MAQYHFLDESGDLGLNLEKNTSSHFFIAMVQLAEREPLNELHVARQKLHLPEHFEFKYHKTTTFQRKIFFKEIQPIPFRIRTALADKVNLGTKYVGMNGQAFTIELITELTLRTSLLDIAKDILVIDGADRGYLRRVRVRLTQECTKSKRVHPFRKIISGDSHREDGLQLADMIVGAIRHHRLGTASNDFKTFEGKIVDLWDVSAS